MAREIVLAGSVRTPIGKFQGGFSSLTAPQLGACAAAEALRRAGVKPEDVQEVIFGHVLQAGVGQNPARQVALQAGIPAAVGAVTINKVCGSGLKAVMLAAQAIRAGDADVILAGGMESMTNSPYMLPAARAGFRLGHAQVVDSMVADGLWDVANDFHMGITAEKVAAKYEVTREDQDAYSAESQRRACAAMQEGRFTDEIVPVEVPRRKQASLRIEKDEGPRPETTAESLGKLRPAFQKDGAVTPGNSSTINDGAASVLVLSAEAAQRLGVRPEARVTEYATGGLDPEWVMMAPFEAVKNLTAKTGVAVGDYDLVEMNEAFAAASVALLRRLELDAAKVNVNGGAIALGHPIGATGCRILVTLLHALRTRNLKTGLATLCLGGGNAVALGVERIGG